MDAHQVASGMPTMRWTPRRLLPASDDRLARLVAAGSEDAFAALYDRYHQRLYRYCRAMLGKDEDAEDALQSTFAGAYAALAQGRRDAPMRPWLYRIAHNESVSVMRRRRPEVEMSEDRVPPGASGVSGVSGASAAEVADERGRLALLIADLAALTERQRAALVMRELGGLSHSEIAAALKVDESGAKQTIFEARRSLQEFAEGRAMVCDEVCRAISTGGGRTLRGRKVRAHLRDCGACQAFADAIRSRTKSLHALAPPLAGAAATSILRRAIASGAGHGSRGGAGVAAGMAGKTAGVVAVGKALAGAAAVATVAAGATGIARLVAPAPAHRTSAAQHRSHAAARGPLVSVPAGRPMDLVAPPLGVALDVRGPRAAAVPHRGHLTASGSRGSTSALGRGHARSANASSPARGIGRGADHGKGSASGKATHGAARAGQSSPTHGLNRAAHRSSAPGTAAVPGAARTGSSSHAAHRARTSAGGTRSSRPGNALALAHGRGASTHAAAVRKPAQSAFRATGRRSLKTS